MTHFGKKNILLHLFLYSTRRLASALSPCSKEASITFCDSLIFMKVNKNKIKLEAIISIYGGAS